MEISVTNKQGRQAYEKPILRTIDLVAEEVLAAGCKTATGSSTAMGGGSCALTGCGFIGS